MSAAVVSTCSLNQALMALPRTSVSGDVELADAWKRFCPTTAKVSANGKSNSHYYARIIIICFTGPSAAVVFHRAAIRQALSDELQLQVVRLISTKKNQKNKIKIKIDRTMVCMLDDSPFPPCVTFPVAMSRRILLCSSTT